MSMIESYYMDEQARQPEVFDLNKAVINALGDPECRKILEATFHRSRIVSEIMKERKIPQTSIYRKINHLYKLGLLKSTEHFDTKRHVFYKYKCTLANLILKFDGKFDLLLAHNK